MNSTEEGKYKSSKNLAQKIAGKFLIEAVRGQGYEPEDIEDAWGRVIKVQAEIALNPEMGSKATTAAKFLAHMIGFDEGDTQQAEVKTDQSREAFKYLLGLIESERQIRADDKD